MSIPYANEDRFSFDIVISLLGISCRIFVSLDEAIWNTAGSSGRQTLLQRNIRQRGGCVGEKQFSFAEVMGRLLPDLLSKKQNI
jgi:hypothetical protein